MIEMKPLPLTVGTRVKRTVRGSSARHFTFETKTRGEMRSKTDFAFVVDTEVTALKDGVVDEVSFRIERAARETDETVLTPGAWVPPGRPLRERPILLDGVSARLRRDGPRVTLTPEGGLTAEERDVVEKVAGALLGHAVSELEVPATALRLGEEAPEIGARVRALVAREIGWARVPSDPLRAEAAPPPCVVAAIDAAAAGGATATLRFSLGRELPDGTMGSAVSLTGELRIRADGRPVQLRAAGTTAHAIRTMAGIERAKGDVSIEVAWE